MTAALNGRLSRVLGGKELKTERLTGETVTVTGINTISGVENESRTARVS
jgi:hypothetical protein